MNPTGTLRATEYGPVRGVDNTASSNTLSWKGIPFAKPPLGPLRWKAPVDPDPWPQGRDATTFGHACVQVGRLFGPGAEGGFDASISQTMGKVVGSEDCLTLNIWRPSGGEESLPVIYFIHGGSNITGYTADPLYDGATLARTANAVVVTANYRLGVFGWLHLPQLKTGESALDDSGNFALLDMVKVLQFIRNNIEYFGGDPGNVTIMGQSAGALNVYALLVSPQTVGKHLFHRAVAISGGLARADELPKGSIATLAPIASYSAQGQALLRTLLVADGKATDDASADMFIAAQGRGPIADYLRSKSAAPILETVLGSLAPRGLASSGPIPDGAVMPASAIAAIHSDNYNKVPVLASTTRDECKLLGDFLALSPALGGKAAFTVSEAARFTLMTSTDPAQLTVGDLIDPCYLPVDAPGTGFTARTDLLNQLFFLSNRDCMLDALKSRQEEVWYSQFEWDQAPPPWNEVYGAAHAIDLPFIFGNFSAGVLGKVVASEANEGGRLALSQAMMGSIGNFARHGNPNHAALGMEWPAWPVQMVFDAGPSEVRLSCRR